MKIQIGDLKDEYKLVRTNAPIDYDYSYVIPLWNRKENNEEVRYILIPESRVNYQRGRYESGMNHVTLEDDLEFSAEDFKLHLIDRLHKRENEQC